MSAMPDVRLDHAERIAALETHHENTKEAVVRLAEEIGKLRKAIWLIAAVMISLNPSVVSLLSKIKM